MADKYEEVIRRQKALVTCLEEQLAADQKLINSQFQQIQTLKEKVSLLEKENQALIDAGNEMSAACGRLEKICSGQQGLLSSFSDIFSTE